MCVESARTGVPKELQRKDDGVLQNLNTALLVVDASARITSSNPPAEQILGESAAALADEPVSRWFAEGGGIELIARTLRDGERFRAVESFVTRRDGTRVPIGISWAPVVDSTGERCGAVATFQDLTGLKQLQSQVVQTEKMASIGQLAAGVAHEINNPMGFIHANLFQMAEYVTDLRRVWTGVDALRKAVGQGHTGEIRDASQQLSTLIDEADVDFVLSDLSKAIRESQEGSERIRHIVQDLRDFSHHDTNERVLADVNQCLDSTASIVWPMMKHLVKLEKDYEVLPSVWGFPMQLKQVFMNLLVNAYQAIEEKVSESGGMGTIQLVTRAVEGGVSIHVTDSGNGIAGDVLDRIFDPFFTTKKVGAGTGLGLSTSYSIVKRHGGRFEVSSEEGGGATFGLFLPMGDEDEVVDPD